MPSVSRFRLPSFLVGVMALLVGALPAAAIENTIVYIECTGEGGTVASRGTGVVVSPQGHVLTAKHVVPSGTSCRGSIGTADSNITERLVLRPTNVPVDAALLQFARNQEYEFASYCKLEPWMVRRKIFVAGYPGETETGVPSYREGILSTVFPNADLIIETDGQTVAGMSGGPVYSRNLAGIVGLVIGAKFDAQGVSYYGILPIADYAQIFNLTESEIPCYHQYREVLTQDLVDPVTNEPSGVWMAGDPERRLGVSEDYGYCFIGAIKGEWNDPGDEVSVEVKDGEYVIRGENYGGGEHGAWARCIMYD